MSRTLEILGAMEPGVSISVLSLAADTGMEYRQAARAIWKLQKALQVLHVGRGTYVLNPEAPPLPSRILAWERAPHGGHASLTAQALASRPLIQTFWNRT